MQFWELMRKDIKNCSKQRILSILNGFYRYFFEHINKYLGL